MTREMPTGGTSFFTNFQRNFYSKECKQGKSVSNHIVPDEHRSFSGHPQAFIIWRETINAFK
jgi:hypothetical protein